jgi:hypothetical protein
MRRVPPMLHRASPIDVLRIFEEFLVGNPMVVVNGLGWDDLVLKNALHLPLLGTLLSATTSCNRHAFQGHQGHLRLYKIA